jgi:hypothetical protein
VKVGEHRQETLKTFITSSPKWLMTFTAMRPDLGFSKGREVSLLRVAQASGNEVFGLLNVVGLLETFA